MPNDSDEVPLGALQRVPVQNWTNKGHVSDEDWVAVETAVALTYNGISHAVMMATPADLEDFALGFSITEGVINKPEELYDLQLHSHEQGVEVQMEISSRRQVLLKQQRRNLSGRTGCGLCGVESLQQVSRTITPLENVTPLLDVVIQKALQQLPHWQPLRQTTGACHGAAWCSLEGDIVMAREDVGRHNALDKLIGALLRAKINCADGFVVISSRASFEMVQKSAGVGIGNIVAVSAPTSLALQTARNAGVNLIAFGRDGRHVNYIV